MKEGVSLFVGLVFALDDIEEVDQVVIVISHLVLLVVGLRGGLALWLDGAFSDHQVLPRNTLHLLL